MTGTKCGGGIHELCMESPMISIPVASLSDSTGPKNKLPFNNWDNVQEREDYKKRGRQNYNIVFYKWRAVIARSEFLPLNIFFYSRGKFRLK